MKNAVADQLLMKDIVKSRQAANATQVYAMMWMEGVDIRTQLKRRQFYEHKSRLKKIGIDVSCPFDVTRMSPTILKRKAIEVSDLQIPSWYRNVITPHLSLVS